MTYFRGLWVGLMLCLCVSTSFAQNYQAGQQISYKVLGSYPERWEQGTVEYVTPSGKQIIIREKPNEFYPAGNTRAYNFDEVRAPDATAPAPNNGPAQTYPATPPAVAAPAPETPLDPVQTSQAVSAEGPRLGKYYMQAINAYANTGLSPYSLVGSFELLAGGRYIHAGVEGRWSFSGGRVAWLSGPFQEQNLLGDFEITREGLTHKIILKRTDSGREKFRAVNSSDRN